MHDTDWNMVAATQKKLDFHPEMRFIINGQAYRVSNVDNVSIDNVSILSLVDDKLLDTDDIINGIAYDDVYEYTIKNKLTDDTKLYAGDVMELPVLVLRNGVEVDEDVILTSSDESIIQVDGRRLIGRGLGTAIINVALALNNTISIDIPIKVSEEHTQQEVKIYITGDDYIEWGTSQTYMLSDGSPAAFEVETLSKIRKEISFTENSVTISIKDKHSGTFIISADTAQGRVEKTVYIRTV